MSLYLRAAAPPTNRADTEPDKSKLIWFGITHSIALRPYRTVHKYGDIQAAVLNDGFW